MANYLNSLPQGLFACKNNEVYVIIKCILKAKEVLKHDLLIKRTD